MANEPSTRPPPNHHADHKGFAGVTGWIAAQIMRAGRRADAATAARLTGLAAGDCVVDIGCGPGVAARHAAKVGARVTGVDPSDTMLRVAARHDRASDVTWRIGGAEALPLDDDVCDIAWALATVHHWPDLDGALAEVQRVLSPGGRFLALERRVKSGATGLASHGWTDAQAEEFAAMCEAAGFAKATVSTQPGRRGAALAVLATVA